MDRRAFLKTATAAVMMPWRDAGVAAGWRTFEVNTRIEIQRALGTSRAWLPLPLATDTEWQHNLGNRWSGNASHAEVVTDDKYGAAMLDAEWPAGQAAPVLDVTSRIATHDRATDLAQPRTAGAPPYHR
jgi:hypothetical protein